MKILKISVLWLAVAFLCLVGAFCFILLVCEQLNQPFKLILLQLMLFDSLLGLRILLV